MNEETRKMNIGCNISTLRHNCGMTQEQLAEKVHASVDHIARVESGRSGISLWLLLDICSALDVTPNDILAGAYLHDDNARQHDGNSISLADVSPSDEAVLKCIHYFMKNQKKNGGKYAQMK